MNTRFRLLNIFCAVLLASGFLPARTAQAATVRELIAVLPSNPVYTQSVRVWMYSDTQPGEVAVLGYLDYFPNYSYYVLGTYDDTTYPGANWYADIPPFDVGDNIAIQLYTRAVDGTFYGFTGFLTFYVVQDLPSTVYVDDDWAGTMAGTDPDGAGPATNFGGDAFATIHAGVAGLKEGGTIHVAAGNYYESDLMINKPLTLIGAGEGQTIIGPVLADAHQCNPLTSAHQGIIVSAHNITLQGFTLDGNADGSLAGDHHYRIGILTNYSSATYSNLTVQDVTIQHVWYRGVVVRPKSGETSSGHQILNVTVDDLAGCKLAGEARGQTFGILYYDAGGEIAHTTISNAGSGIAASSYTATPLQVNIHHNAVSLVDVQAYTLVFNATGSLFDYNTAVYEGATNSGIALLVDQPQGLSLHHNNFTGAKIGVFMGRQAGPPENLFIGEGNLISGPGAGVYFTHGILADGSSLAANVNTNFTVEGTTITNYSTGISLDRADSTGVNNVVVRGNNLVNNGLGLFKGVRSNLTLDHNRILDNSYAGVESITTTLVAENNWWGCNEGPGNPDCDEVSGLVDAVPWLVLTTGASDASVAPGSTLTLQPKLVFNSASQDTSATGTVADGIPATFSAPEGGMVVPAEGETLNGSFGDVVFTPPLLPHVYRACVDVDHEQVCNSLSIQNAAPQAVADAYAGTEDILLSVSAPGVLANDSDANQTAITAILITDAALGDLTLNADGSFTYLPDYNWGGEDSFTYKASDGSLQSAETTVTLTIAQINDAPVAQNQTVSLAEDTSLPITLVATDDEGTPLTYSVGDPGHGILTGTAPELTYTPNLNFNGSDSFTFIASDGVNNSNQATVNITVTPVNDAPLASDQSLATPEDTSLAITLVALDVDGDALTWTVGTPQHGSLSGSAPNLTYTPATNWYGVDSFTFYVRDGSLTSNTATVQVNVSAVNDAPVASGQSVSLAEDGSKAITLAAVDIESDPLTWLVGNPQHGSLSGTAPNLTYTPNPDYNGSDSFTFKVNDGAADSNLAMVTITVSPVNDAPVANPDAYTIGMNGVLSLQQPGVLANDVDVDWDVLMAYRVETVQHGSLTFNASGSFVYVPDSDWSGSDSFSYYISDGRISSATVTVNLTVTPTNQPPVAQADSFSVTEEVMLYVAAPGLLFNDSDPDGNPLQAFVAGQPLHGVAFVNLDGSFGYTPAPNFFGQDTFYYIAYDGLAYSPSQAVIVNVLPVNDGPQAVADAYSADEDVLLQVDAGNGLLANDIDVDGDPLTANLVTGPQHGDLTLNPDGSFSYAPDANYNGGDSFTYRVSDGLLQSGTVTVTLTVNPVNDPPVANDLLESIWGGEVLSGILTASDVDSSILTFALADAPGHGSVEVGSDGAFTYTPEPGYQGEDSFTFTVSDGAGGLDTGQVTIQITVANKLWLPLIVR